MNNRERKEHAKSMKEFDRDYRKTKEGVWKQTRQYQSGSRKKVGNGLAGFFLIVFCNYMAELQADLEQREYTPTSGGGMIEVEIDGKHPINGLRINHDAVDPEDTERLEDVIAVAVNEAVSNAEKTAEDEMGAITGGLNMPGLF